MFLLGGVLFWLIGLMDEAWPGAPLAVQMALGAWGITCAEFLTGLVVNRALGLGVGAGCEPGSGTILSSHTI